MRGAERAACGVRKRCQDCGRWRNDPVDRLWAPDPASGLQTRPAGRRSGNPAPSPATDRMLDSTQRDLRGRTQQEISSMAEQVPSPQPRILYIEDNPESRALVRNVLEARGFDVLEASDGIAGIDLAISAH